MLTHLTIHNFVLIDHLQLAFQNGLTVFTGETGAGKSILLDALSFALGSRGDGGFVSSGQKKGTVIANFDLPLHHSVFAKLKAHDIETEGELILRRVQFSDGRTRSYINDQPVSVTFLRTIGSELIEIHGQHDERALVDTVHHRQLLDAFANLNTEQNQLTRLYHNWKDAISELERLQKQLAETEREAEYLRGCVKELEALAPKLGEEETLAERRQLMMQSEKVISELKDAQEFILGGHSPVPVLVSLTRRLERKFTQTPELLENIVAALDRSIVALEESGSMLEQLMQQTTFDSHELESIEERLFALRAASRKYNVSVGELAAFSEKMAKELDIIDNSSQHLEELQKNVLEAKHAYLTAAQNLSRQRQIAAKMLEEKVEAELPALKLENAQFFARLISNENEYHAHGIDKIAFWIRTNPGAELGPMQKVASGGELSRFLLALKVVLADKGSAPCLVFDEIDTGIGGAVAEAIGRRLARLGQKVQVLSVTHAPQVAAHAQNHFVVKKQIAKQKDQTNTVVQSVSNDTRQEEIARMLAGAQITDEARAAAGRLISETPVSFEVRN